MAPTKPRTIVYIDGLNFYYGAVKDTPYKWLNLQQFFQRLRPDDDIVSIKYFTSWVAGPAQRRQAPFIRALSTLPLVKVVLGKFKSKSVKCSHPKCTYQGDRIFESLEEKRTDVNIAVAMLDDAYQDASDRVVLVSGDSDLVPAVQQIKARFPGKQIVVYGPVRHAADERRADELRRAANTGRKLPTALLEHCQLPSELTDRNGYLIKKPSTW